MWKRSIMGRKHGGYDRTRRDADTACALRYLIGDFRRCQEKYGRTAGSTLWKDCV